jgi:hypothetical protein
MFITPGQLRVVASTRALERLNPPTNGLQTIPRGVQHSLRDRLRPAALVLPGYITTGTSASCPTGSRSRRAKR